MTELADAANREAVLATAIRWIPHVVEAEHAMVALFNGTHFQMHARSHNTIVAIGKALAIEGSMVGAAVESKQIVRIDPDLEPATPAAAFLRASVIGSGLLCPIVANDRTLAVLALGHQANHAFDGVDEPRLKVIVSLIGSFMSVFDVALAEHQRANTDHLTGCLNRRAILDHLDRQFETDAPRPSVLYLDVDSFKATNDMHGHEVGDDVLRSLARRITGTLQAEDRLGRLGGDEFLIVVHEDPDGHRAAEVAAQIGELTAMPIAIRSINVTSRLSIGLASVAQPGHTAVELLRDADEAMYAAKESRKTLVIANAATRGRAAMIATIDRDLDRALANGGITYHYQPIRNTTTHEIMGAEALIRWTHPNLGEIPAPLLIKRLETTGRTEAFTRWSIETVCRDWAQLRTRVPEFADKAVGVNLSPRQLAWEGYCDLHFDALDRYGFRPQDLLVEVVESEEIRTGDAAEATLKTLGNHDVVIGLNDFGAGHSALGYFTMFPIHAIKFDRSMVSRATTSETARTILAGLAALSRDLGVVSLGEGIETEGQARVCRDLGIEHGQGWHYGRPQSLAGFIADTQRAQPVRV